VDRGDRLKDGASMLVTPNNGIIYITTRKFRISVVHTAEFRYRLTYHDKEARCVVNK
jgi:hypothetical protein